MGQTRGYIQHRKVVFHCLDDRNHDIYNGEIEVFTASDEDAKEFVKKKLYPDLIIIDGVRLVG